MNKTATGTGLIRSLDGTRQITVEEFDRMFDDGSDEIDQFVDWSKGTRPNLEIKRVNLDLPIWMIHRLDAESRRLGVARQALIKMWLAEKLDGKTDK